MIIRLSAAALVLASAGLASAQVLYTGGTYVQEFDTLASTGTAARPTGPTSGANPAGQLFNNNSTLPGWVATFENTVNVGTTAPSGTNGNWIGAGVINNPQPNTIPDFNTRFIRIDNGGMNGGSMYSYGTTAASDRALGALNSGGATTPLRNAFGVRIQNATSDSVVDPIVSYVGERWRIGGSTADDRLDFSYRIVAANSTFVIDDYRPTVTTGWTNLNALDFGLALGAPAAATDGNLAANRSALSATLTGVTLAPGEELQIRWVDFDAAGSDDGLAVDEFRFSAGQPVPEPATMAALGLGALALLRRRRR